MNNLGKSSLTQAGKNSQSNDYFNGTNTMNQTGMSTTNAATLKNKLNLLEVNINNHRKI
jgi:hypothetical protein